MVIRLGLQKNGKVLVGFTVTRTTKTYRINGYDEPIYETVIVTNFKFKEGPHDAPFVPRDVKHRAHQWTGTYEAQWNAEYD